MMINTALVLAGLLLLLIGGELLVRGAVRAAKSLGISELLIGLTLVGFATSAPEMVTSVNASLRDAPGIAIGNFVGSNISNILLILGLSAVLYPIAVESKALKRDGVIVLVSAVLFAAASLLVPYDRIFGAVFLVCLFLYIAYACYQEYRLAGHEHTSAYEKAEAHKQIRERSQHEKADQKHPAPSANPADGAAVSLFSNLGLAIIGMLIIVGGGHLLVDGAVGIARLSGVPEEVIGLTVVAIGTSMPEFATSLVAALRGYSSVALGNIMGSNIYNTLGIGGLTALIAPTTIPQQIAYYDNWIMIAASLAFLLFATTDFRIRRWEGLVLVFGYIAYLFSMLPAQYRAYAIERASNVL